MDFGQEAGWQLHPLKGETGKAYMGIKDSQKVFLKRNTSPFLAALSMEGITPRLVWTKRMENGDVLTAQEWCNGRNLARSEMSDQKVVDLLLKVHHSTLLKRMLSRLGGHELLPANLLTQYKSNLPEDLLSHPTLRQAQKYLEEGLINRLDPAKLVVCHGDLSRKNWLISDDANLYLVDWDSVALADPAYDIGQILSRYSDSSHWLEWIYKYDKNASKVFLSRVKWYAVMNILKDTKSAYFNGRLHQINKNILKVDQWF